MSVITSYLSQLDELNLLLKATKKEQNILLSGVTPSFYDPLVEVLYKFDRRGIVILTQNLYHAQRLYDQLTNSLPKGDVLLFPMDEFITAEMLAASSELRTERMNTLTSLIKDNKKIVITHVAGVTRHLTPKEAFKQAEINLAIGDIYDLDRLKIKLVELGYKSVRAVEHTGEFSFRGGIVDIFPMTEIEPYRVEFFDDEVDTIRRFSTETQLSIEKVNELFISPTYELVYSDEQFKSFDTKIKTMLHQTALLLDDEPKEALYEKIYRDIEQIKNHQNLDVLHKYTSLIYE